MEDYITLQSISLSGKPLKAIFHPSNGMDLVSYQLGEIEVIEQNVPPFQHSTLIGPHFLNRKKELLEGLKKDSQLNDFMKKREEEGFSDPFQHGVSRYVAWKVESFNENKIKAALTGKELWHETPLAAIEGQQFKLFFQAELTPEGLHIKLSSIGESDTVIGIDYHYALPDSQGTVFSDIASKYYENGVLKEVPKNWFQENRNDFHFELKQAADYAFFPSKNPLKGSILLKTANYQLQTDYQSVNQENCWQLYKPRDASYVCIRPLSAQNPWRPNLTVSSIDILLSIKEL